MGECSVGEVAPKLILVELVLAPRKTLPQIRRGADCPDGRYKGKDGEFPE